MKKIKIFLLCLFLCLLLLSFTSCGKTVSVYRNYAGENENYEVNVRVQLEYDGSPKVPKGITFGDEKLQMATRYEIKYIGEKDVENLRITQINWGSNSCEGSQNQNTGYMSLFDENNKYIMNGSPQQYIDLIEPYYFIQFTYDGGATERINTQLTSSKGEIIDLELVFKRD